MSAEITLRPDPPNSTGVRRAVLVANPRAGHVAERLKATIGCLETAGWEITRFTPEQPSDLPKFISGCTPAPDCLVVAGGDGTLNRLADVLVEIDLPVGIIPLGTANDLARTLGLPPQPEQACGVICDGVPRRIDVGWVNGKHFFNVAGIGLSVDICRRLDRESKKRWGILAYPLTTAKVLCGLRPFHATVFDGHTRMLVKTVQITVGNGRFFGGGMSVDDEATIDDGIMNLYSIEVRRWWELPMIFYSLRRGAVDRLKQVRALRGDYFEIHTRRPRRVNTDGEVTTVTPAVFKIIPKALTVLTPRTTPADAGITPAASAVDVAL